MGRTLPETFVQRHDETHAKGRARHVRMDKTVAESRKRDEEKAEVLTCNYCS
jgi:hypothetical protein